MSITAKHLKKILNMNQKIQIFQSNVQQTHATTTIFLSVKNHLYRLPDVIRIHARNDRDGEMMANGLSARLQNLTKRDDLIDQLADLLKNDSSKEIINLVKKIQSL